MLRCRVILGLASLESIVQPQLLRRAVWGAQVVCWPAPQLSSSLRPRSGACSGSWTGQPGLCCVAAGHP